jgi:hypothetical protein
VGWLAAFLAPVPAQAQVCAPLDDGRLAEAFYEGTVIFWEPVVEFREMVLTIGGPCEDITKIFKKGEPISFDVREITKLTDGSYTWQLRRVASIDSGVQKDLEASRGTGKEDAVWWNYFQKGAIPEGPYVDSASFTVERGVIVDPNQVEGKRAAVASRAGGALAGSSLAAGLAAASGDGTAGGNGLATRDQVIPDDLIVQGSACVGFDCVNGESFGFDTIRLKENNLRIQFNDTSVGSFPTGNWQIRGNSSASGGQSFLGFVDQGASGTSETGTLVFAVEAGARANALYVESDGDVGLGTSNPVLDFHISSSNTPGLRLEQTNAGGFTAQTWDIAGNEANFFVRDVTGGSTLPFRIRPGAPSSSIDISADGDVGIGTASPSNSLHVRRTDGTAKLLVEEGSSTEAARELATFQNNGTVTYRFTDTQGTASGADDFNWIAGLKTNNQFIITLVGTIGTPLWQMDSSGNVTATSFNPTSSRELKEAFEGVDPRDVLARVSELPIAEWQYRDDITGARHIGPTAEDFKAAFGLNGPDEQHLSLTDLSGVALVAIQGLHQEIETKDVEIDRLEQDNRELNERLEALERLVASVAPAGD